MRAPRPRTRVGLFSYGSGSAAEFFAGRLGEQAGSTLAAHGIRQHLDGRRAVSVAEYESLVTESECGQTSAAYVPSRDGLDGHYQDAYHGRRRLVLERIENHYRTYVWS